MQFDKEELRKQILDQLAKCGVFISNNAPPLNKEKALVLLGEAILDKFFREFMNLWKNELFPDCLLKNYEASDQEVHEWVHGGDPQPDCKLCSNHCKGVNEKMDENMKQKLDGYLELFQELKQQTGSESIALALTQEIAKDDRTNQIQEQINLKNNEPATDKQKRFMKKLNIAFPAAVTKKEASALIDEELGRNSNNE